VAGLGGLVGGLGGGGSAVGSAVVRLFLDSSQYEQGLAKAKGSTTAAASGMSGATKAVTTGFIALGALAVIAIDKGIKATTEWAGEVRGLMLVTGQSAESASGLAGAAEHLGIGVDQLGIGFKTLEKNVVTNSAALAGYGIVTKDANGVVLPFDELLGRVQDKFATLPTAADKTAFAVAAFGKAGTKLLPILAQGRDGLAELEAAARAAGLVMSQDDLDAAKALTLAQRDLGSAFKGASIAMGKTFIPVATDLVGTLTSVVELVSKIPAPVLEAGLKFFVLTGALAAVTKAAEFFSSTWGDIADTLGLVSDSATTVEASTALLADATRVAADTAVVAKKANTGLAASELAVAAAQKGAAASTASVIAADEAWAAANEATTVTIEQQIIAIQERNAAASLGAAGLGATGVIAIGGKLPRGGFAAPFNVTLPAETGANAAMAENITATRPAQFVSSTPEQLAASAKSLDLNAEALQRAHDQGILYSQALEQMGLAADGTSTATAGLTSEIDITRLAIASAGVSFDAGAKSLTALTAISGETSDEFRDTFSSAFKAAGDAAAKAGEEFDTTAGATAAFQVAVDDAMTKAATAIENFRTQATASLAQFGSDALSGLTDAAHLSVDKVTESFDKAARATRQFGRDVLAISRKGGDAGKDLANQLLAMGPAAAGLASFIAEAGGKAQASMIRHFGAIGTAADKAASKITDSIVGTLDDISSILQQIAKAWGIDIDLPGGDKVKEKLGGIHQNLLDLSSPFLIPVAVNDNASPVITGIQRGLDSLHDKTVRIDIIERLIREGR
jgi:hypothetical protein